MDYLLVTEVAIIDKYVMVYAYVPEHILACHELSYLDKLVYIRIIGFCRNDNNNNICFASNGYFANLFGVKPKAISVAIGKLKRMNLINVTYVKDKNLVRQRNITLIGNIWSHISNGNSLNTDDIITQNGKDNSKYNNKINNIISYDTDGVMLWNGKRCEADIATEEEQIEMRSLLAV